MRLRACLLAVAVAVAVAVAAGCATPHGERAPNGSAVGAYQLEGRFGLRDPANSYSGRLSWRHDATGDRVLVLDPFGNGVAELDSGPQGARMRLSDGRVVEAADAGELMHRLTGVALPVGDLARWLTGRETVGAGDPLRDAQGRLVRQQRAGWRLEYAYGDDAADALPDRVSAAGGPGIELRLAIESWGVGGAP